MIESNNDQINEYLLLQFLDQQVLEEIFSINYHYQWLTGKILVKIISIQCPMNVIKLAISENGDFLQILKMLSKGSRMVSSEYFDICVDFR